MEAPDPSEEEHVVGKVGELKETEEVEAPAVADKAEIQASWKWLKIESYNALYKNVLLQRRRTQRWNEQGWLGIFGFVWINCVAARMEGILLRRNSWSIESIQIHSTAIAQLVSGNLGDDDDHDVEDDDLMIT